MREKELLTWIDEQRDVRVHNLQCLNKTGQQFPLTDTAIRKWNRSCDDIDMLEELKRIVINWNQVGRGEKENKMDFCELRDLLEVLIKLRPLVEAEALILKVIAELDKLVA